MRRSSLATVTFMLLSGAALAQVSRTPNGKDVPYANMTPSNAAMANTTDPMGNATSADTAPTTPDQKTESATPRR